MIQKTMRQALNDVAYYLENAHYILVGVKQLNVKETQQLREQLNRAANQLQAVKELYQKEQAL
jgi:hypothetical protein